MRLFLGVHKFAANDVLLGDLGWVASEVRRDVSIIRLWNRLVKMDDTRLTKRVFNFECDKMRGKWSKHVLKVLAKMDMEEYFHNKIYCTTKFCQENLWP